MFLSLDGTALIQLINFAIFFALLNVLFLKPVGKAIRKRRDYINGVVRDYDAYQAEANSIRAQAEKVRNDARREAEQRLVKVRADASNQTAELSTRYAQQVQTTVEEAQRKATGVLEAARSNEDALVRQLADALVERATAVGS
jgi:F-type H+-transporting ATPase subunit b